MYIERECIRSRQNPLIKWAASLADGKGRREHRAFLAEGEKLTHEAAVSRLAVTHLFVAEGRSAELIPKLQRDFCGENYEKTRCIVVSDDAFSKISTEKSPEGVISVIKYLDFFRELDIIYKDEFYFSEGERMLALYAIRDPGNLGAVIRSAVAFGVSHILLSADCADVYHPRTVRAAMGGLFRVRITIVRDFPSAIENVKQHGRRFLAAELTANALPIGACCLRATDVILIGNEGHGIPSQISALCSASVFIPISSTTESLNAAVAASVFMWEQSQL